MSLNYPDEPDNAPSDAQFYGPETGDFVAGWYKYCRGQWYWSHESHGSQAKWEETHSLPTLGTDLFIVKTYQLETLQPDAEYLHPPIPNTQLRRSGDTTYVQHPRETGWKKLSTSGLSDIWWSQQIPLADLGWSARSPSSATTPENDVDNW